jgi:hypothetical protein
MDGLTGRLKFGVIGGVLGGLIAIVGYWVLSPSVDSILGFVALRVLVGAVVAMLLGPILYSWLGKPKSG